MIDVMIITYNEAQNLPHCLAALQGWVRRVFVVDSGSTDETCEIARRFGAEVVHHDWEGYARQKNWGLDHLPFASPWILLLDADEEVTPELRDRLVAIASRPAESVPEDGFSINRLTYFLNAPIRHCGYFPSYHLRFFKRGRGRYEDRAVHEHLMVDGPIGSIATPMLHNDRRGLEHFVAKHNRYSTLEATALWEEMRDPSLVREHASLTRQAKFHRWLKRRLLLRLPAPGLWRFVYMYFLRLGFLDGRPGAAFARFIAMYDGLVALKLYDLRRQGRSSAATVPAKAGGLSDPEGSVDARTAGGREVSAVQMHPESSPWTTREKIRRALWMIVGRPLFRASFHNWYRYRATILRLFGAKIGRGVAIRPSAWVEVPWMLSLDDDVTVGDFAILYSLGPIRIGERTIISQYAHLCAGTHDYTDHTFRLIRTPITVGRDVWIGADSFVGPGVVIGDLTVLGARSSAYRSLEPESVYVGNPARRVKERKLR
jgi:acetyltransferase-like isoleucine patch superfamily enzyme/glycosyltransferase involved in cell wall biosynthesis